MPGEPRRRPPGKKPGLNAKRERFVLEYLTDLNATQAAIRAGYSARWAKELGGQLLRAPLVAEAIARGQAAAREEIEVKAADIRQRLKALGFALMTDYATWGPEGVKLRPSSELTPHQVAAIVEVREDVRDGERTVRVKLHDQVAALRLLAQHLGMLVEKHEHKVEGDNLHFYFPHNGRDDIDTGSGDGQ